jgi:hypothetical protein
MPRHTRHCAVMLPMKIFTGAKVVARATWLKTADKPLPAAPRAMAPARTVLQTLTPRQ